MISKKDLNDAEMDTLTKSCSPTIAITANGEVQTHEEATVYVKALDIFLTMKVLENTPAVLSLGKLCDENGYSYQWIKGQKPHLIKNGIRIECNTENFVPIVVPGLSTSSSSRSSSFNFNDTFKTGEALFYIFLKLVFFSKLQHQVTVRLEKDRIKVKVIPLQCLCPVVCRESNHEQGRQANQKTPKNKKKETMIERGHPLFADSGRASSETPEWLQEFRENLVDDEVPEH